MFVYYYCCCCCCCCLDAINVTVTGVDIDEDIPYSFIQVMGVAYINYQYIIITYSSNHLKLNKSYLIVIKSLTIAPPTYIDGHNQRGQEGNGSV